VVAELRPRRRVDHQLHVRPAAVPVADAEVERVVRPRGERNAGAHRPPDDASGQQLARADLRRAALAGLPNRVALESGRPQLVGAPAVALVIAAPTAAHRDARSKDHIQKYVIAYAISCPPETAHSVFG